VLGVAPEMDSGQALSILWNFVMGIFILWGYWNILYKRIYVYGALDNTTNKWLWAVFHKREYFIPWCISAVLATISYFVVFGVVICARTDFTGTNSIGFLVSNSLFLIFSSLYSFLVFRVFKESGKGAEVYFSKVAVILDLVCVVVTAFCMAIFLVIDQKDVGQEIAATFFAFYLFAHCFVGDLLCWGITWWKCDDKDIHHEGTYNIIFSAAMDTDPSTMGIFSRLRIKQKDVQFAA
jgi:hypothetical protein